MLVIEFSSKAVGGHQHVEVVMTIPGRAGTSRRIWKAPGATLEPSQAEDLHAVVSSVLWDWLMLAGGLQAPLTPSGLGWPL